MANVRQLTYVATLFSGNNQFPIAVTIILSLLTVLVIVVIASAFPLTLWKISMFLITSFVESFISMIVM